MKRDLKKGIWYAALPGKNPLEKFQAAKEAGIAVKRSQIRTILVREGVRWRHTHSLGTAHDKDFVPKERRSSPTTPNRLKGRRPSAATNSAP